MAISIERVEVGTRRVEALVRVTEPTPLCTSAVTDLRVRAAALLPGLERHTCENEAHRSFLHEIADTEVPHLLEHVATELMALSGSPRNLKAETVWDFRRDGPGVFHVRLDYDDDLVAVGALKEALAVVVWLLDAQTTTHEPDVSGSVERLRRVRRS